MYLVVGVGVSSMTTFIGSHKNPGLLWCYARKTHRCCCVTTPSSAAWVPPAQVSSSASPGGLRLPPQHPSKLSKTPSAHAVGPGVPPVQLASPPIPEKPFRTSVSLTVALSCFIQPKFASASPFLACVSVIDYWFVVTVRFIYNYAFINVYD